MKDFSDFSELDAMKDHPVSGQIDQLFKTVIKEKIVSKPKEELTLDNDPVTGGSELSLDGDGEFEIDLGGGEDSSGQDIALDEGFELSIDEGESFDLAGDGEVEEEGSEDHYGEIALGDEEEDGLYLSDEDEELAVEEGTIENLGELTFEDAPEISLNGEISLADTEAGDSLDLGGDSLDLGGDEGLNLGDAGELSLSDEALSGDISLSDEHSLDELSLSGETPTESSEDGGLSLSDDIPSGGDLDIGEEVPVEGADISLSFDSGDSLGLSEDEADLSDDAREKLKEIDAIMDLDASQVMLQPNLSSQEEDLDEPLVSPDLDLDSLNFSQDETQEEVVIPKEEKSKKKKKEVTAVHEMPDHNYGKELKEISGAYSGEMERMQATISNLRADREELLQKIQKFEDEKVLQSRQSLTLRAELDEKKIELTIIRKKLNEEINELKDRLKLFDEKRLILEEKNRLLSQELDKAAQKNKIDVKKVQMRERELEQKLELLKADAETQIRNRDLKILELKRKIDAMEFDMESISEQEKRSVESRYELEDKLDKAIKTLRTAITVLEDETDRSNALKALKKNIEV